MYEDIKLCYRHGKWKGAPQALRADLLIDFMGFYNCTDL